MTGRAVVLRCWPGMGGWRPPAALVRSAGLDRRIGVYLFAAGDGGADGDQLGLGAALIARGSIVFHGVLLVPDDLAARDPGALAAVEQWAGANKLDTAMGRQPWRVLTVSEWCDPTARVEDPATKVPERPWCFAPRAYGGAGPVIGADLGRAFGLLAEHVEARQGQNVGSWQVWLPGWGVPRPEHGDIGKASPHRPPLRVRPTRSGWSVGFGPCARGFGKYVHGRQWRGDFVDVTTAAYVFDADRAAGFVEHGRNLGVTVGELPVAVPVDADGAASVARAVGDVHRVGLAVDEHASRWFTSPTDRAEGRRRLALGRLRSPATLATAIPGAFGVEAPLVRFDLDEAEHQGWCEAFGGGWVDCEPRLAGRPFDAVAVDLSSAYPLVAHHVGWWDVMTAERLGREDVTAELRQVCEQAAADPTVALDPATWATFGLTLAEVDMAGEPLFVEVDDPGRADGRTAMAPTVCRGRTLSVTWCDALASSILARRPVQIVRAVRFVPEGRQPGLRRQVPLLPGTVLHVDQDPAVALVQLRRAVKGTDPNLGHVLHAVVNSMVSGNPSRLDDRWRKVGRGWRLGEKPGPWTFFPLAATATAGARLLLAVLDRQVSDLGGVVAYRDTDSSIIPACPDGAVVTMNDGTEVRALAWAEVDELLGTFAALSPEPAWPVWKQERGTPEKLLRSVSFGAKRHVEYVDDADGPLLGDWTESGLGGMWADPPAMGGRCEEGGRAWSKAAVLRELAYLDAKAKDPTEALRGPASWDTADEPAFPTMRRLQVPTAKLLGTLPDALGARVGSRFVEAQGGGGTTESPGAVALDPGGPLDEWARLRWLDRHTGQCVRVSTDRMDAAYGAVILETLAARAAMYASAPQAPAVGEAVVTPLSVRYRGRVSGVIDAQEAGYSGDLVRFRPVYADTHGLGPGQCEALVAAAKALSPAEFARRASTTTRVARLIAEGKLPRAATTKRIVRALGAAEIGDLAGPVCALDGCALPVERPNARYCGPTHRSTARKRRQRAAQVSPTGPTPGHEAKG